MPFTNPAGDGPAKVVLEQVDDVHFRVLVPFKYVNPGWGMDYDVPDPDNPDDLTDLASVPVGLRWLIASYGQHTKAALVHDRLVRTGMPLQERVEADTVFFRALEESGNNWMRHRLMWAAVAVGGTMWSHAKVLAGIFFAHVFVFWVTSLWAVGVLAWLQRQPWLDWIPYFDRLPFEQHREWATIAAAALVFLGFAWHAAPTADRALSWWMWLAAAIGIGLIAPPWVLIAVSVRVVQLIDYLVAAARSIGPQPYEPPRPVNAEKASAREA
jgi:hypothetical protein